MNKEKQLLKRNLIIILGFTVLFILLWFIFGIAQGKVFKEKVTMWGSQVRYDEIESNQLQLRFERDDIVKLESFTKEGSELVYTLSPLKQGTIYADVCLIDTDESVESTVFRVLPSGTIVDLSTGNFTNHRTYQWLIGLYSVGIAILLWMSFGYVQKELRYSYQAIFYCGLAIWESLLAILLIRVCFMNDDMYDIYSTLQSAAVDFMFISSPLVLSFGIALSISNIQLIRKEGFRTRNALGIILSAVMIIGLLLEFVISNIFQSGSEMEYRIFSACSGIYSSIYAFMECFLMGAIVCGILAAKHEPKYDKDYLIILGCKVKKDGGLYPLIQARVDRAISFYQKQYEKTGKKAIFVPSGGQGSDETISEAGAMKCYLLEQGIPEEQILVEDQSRNTVENMRFSKKLIEEHTENAKVAFSTTNFHVFRSGIISRQNQFEPDGMGSRTKWYFWPNAFIREVIGMMSYKWKSILIVLLPIILFLIAIQFVG